MTYDHNKKAGNEGDIVKHVALIAALNVISATKSSEQFNFVDLFAGYAFNPLLDKNEWKNGIGKIHNQSSKVTDKNVRLYFNWYLSRPILSGGIYPGSSLIAHDTLINNGAIPHLTLYDISQKAFLNLKLAFGNTNHSIFNRPAEENDNEITESNFLFIDPPGLFSSQKKDFPKPDDLIKFEDFPKDKNILVWLPITISTITKPPSESKQTINAIKLFREKGYQITKTRWAIGGRVVGCFMAYKLPQKAVESLRAAIENMVEIADWKSKFSMPIQHLEPI